MEHSEDLDIDAIRRETPGCAEVLHLDSAGSSLMPESVLAAQLDHLNLEARIGGYAAREAAAERIEAAYAAIARLIGAAPTEIALQEHATAAWAQAFGAFRFEPGDRILTAETEYASNYLAFLRAARDSGASIEVVTSDDSGALSVPALENLIDARVKLIAVTHVPTNGGLVNPAAEIGRVARAGVQGDEAIEIEVDLAIRDGWHVNSDQPLSDELIATVLTIDPDRGGWSLDGVEYPPADTVHLGFQDEPLNVFQGDVTLKARAIPGNSGFGVVLLRLKIQACDDRVCLKPEELVLEIPAPKSKPAA